MNNSEDRAAIEAVVTAYLEGMIYGQRDKLERAMHPQCMQAGHFGGAYEYLDREGFIQSVVGETAIPEGSPYDYDILSIDITGDVAVVKVADACFGTTFTDYLTMIKHEGQWQIVMKAFFDHAEGSA